MTEFVIAMLALGPLSLGAIQMSMLYDAKSIVNNATFEAARSGSVNNAQRKHMRTALARNMIPLYGGGTGAGQLTRSYAKALFDIKAMEVVRSAAGEREGIHIISPSREAFDEHSRTIDGQRQIPNEHLLHKDHARRDSSGVSLQDANILKIEVTYAYELTVPIVNKMIAWSMLLLDTNAVNAVYYGMDPPRLPIVAMATVRMQSNAYPEEDNASIPPVPVGTIVDNGRPMPPPRNNPGGQDGGSQGGSTGGSSEIPLLRPCDISGTCDDAATDPGTCAQTGDCNTGSPDACGGGTGNQSANTTSTAAGNPINIATGNKFQTEVDLAGLPGKLGLEFIRYYNSDSSYHGNLGYRWRHTYDVQLNRKNYKSIYIDQSDGRRVVFEKRDANNKNIIFANIYSDGWLELKNESATWHWHSGRKLNFGREGRLNYITEKSGQSIFLTYNNDGQILQVSDPQDRTLGFVYYPNNRIKNIVDPDGNSILYSYDEKGNLDYATYSDKTSRIYHYEDSRFIHHLTGLTDGRGVRFASWEYDNKGRAILSTHANGVEKVTLKFKKGKTLVTNTKGVTSTYYIKKINDVSVVTRVDGPGCSSCGSGDAEYKYNDVNQLLEKKNKSGITTRYVYDEKRRLKHVLRSVNGKNEQKLFSHTFIGNDRKVMSLRRPSVVAGKEYIASFKYNSYEQVIEATEKGWMPATSDSNKTNPLPKSISRTTKYDYKVSNGESLLFGIDGPLKNGKLNSPIDSDIIRYEYGNQRNQVTAIIFPGNQRSSIAYNENGRVNQVVTADGRVTGYQYDLRGRVKYINRDGHIQSYQYSKDGSLSEVGIIENGIYKPLTKLGYDDAGRNIWAASSIGVINTFKYDLSDNIIESVKQTAHFKQTQLFEYDSLDRLVSSTNPNGAIRKLKYNTQGFVKQMIDPRGRIRKYFYDSYGDLSSVIEAANTHQERKVKFANDLRGNTKSITGPHGVVTKYVVDDFGRKLEVNSPDSGILSKKYDAADRLIESKDAMGNKSVYKYDYAGRLLSQSVFSANSDEVKFITTFRWKGKQLVAIEHPNQRESYVYDRSNRLIRKDISLTLVDGSDVTYVTHYSWDKVTGQLKSKTLPDGSILTYRKNGQNQLVSVERQSNGYATPQTIVSNISRDLVGLNGYKYGNGIEARFQRSASGKLARIVHRLPNKNTKPDSTVASNDSILPLLGINTAHASMVEPVVHKSTMIDSSSINKKVVTFDLPSDPLALIDHRYQWDKSGNLRHTRNFSSAAVDKHIRHQTYIYDYHDQLIIAAQEDLVDTNEFNMQSVSNSQDIESVQKMWRYFYDDAGNRILAQEQAPNFSEMGHSTKVHYQEKSNKANSIIETDNTINIVYDSAGRPVQQGTRSYKWDEHHHLTQVSDDGKVIATYRYNHRGERISKVAVVKGKQRIQHMLYDGRKLIAELDDKGKILRQYLYFAEQPIAVIDTPEGKSLTTEEKNSAQIWLSWVGSEINGLFDDEQESIAYLHLNHLGAPELATDGNANSIWTASYSPFGQLIKNTGLIKTGSAENLEVESGFQLQLRLPGQYEDEETGLYYNDRRYYDPQRGQYLSSDPLGLRAGINTYAYVENNPLKYIDPTGLIMFAFDGTFNSRNDDTNINILTGIYQDNDSSDQRLIDIGADQPYYISGVGEGDNIPRLDAIVDAALAISIVSRRNVQLYRLNEYIRTKVEVVGKDNISKDKPLMITLDVIGFSRGAASARDFVNYVVNRANSGYFRNLPGVDGACVAVEVRFLGLFDTVLSKSPSGIQLGIPEAVQFASHAVAVNEHRDLFPLESIEPSFADIGFSSNRTERGFVGAHADIGGGYNGDTTDPLTAPNGDRYDGGDLSDVALNWMVQQAKDAGVTLGQLDNKYLTVRNPIVHDESNVSPYNLLGGDDREVRYSNAGDAPRNTPQPVFCGIATCTPMPMQKTAQIDGMTTQDSQQFITPINRQPTTPTPTPNPCNGPNPGACHPIPPSSGPPANNFGTVDMSAYNSWLSSNYGFSMQ